MIGQQNGTVCRKPGAAPGTQLLAVLLGLHNNLFAGLTTDYLARKRLASS